MSTGGFVQVAWTPCTKMQLSNQVNWWFCPSYLVTLYMLKMIEKIRSCSMASKHTSSSSRQNKTKAALSFVSPMETVPFLLVEFPRGQILSEPPLSNQMHLLYNSFSILLNLSTSRIKFKVKLTNLHVIKDVKYAQICKKSRRRLCGTV